MRIHLPKEQPGLFFPDLDMLTTLLPGKKETSTTANAATRGIEELETNPVDEDQSDLGSYLVTIILPVVC